MTTAQATWVGPGLRLVGEANQGPAIVVDSSKAPLGTHSGPTPMELVLMGLAGCTGMDVISVLNKMRQPFTGVQVIVEGEQADANPKVYTKISVTYHVYGKGVDPKAVARAVELSETTYCPVMAMLRKTRCR